MVDKPSGNPTNSDVIECGLEKDRLGADGVAKGEIGQYGWPIRVGGYRAWSRGVTPKSLRQ
jgi:hypothetical protein